MRDTITQPYYEVEPTVWEELRNIIPTKQGARSYVKSLFPCIGWLPRYNWRWLLGDCIAGLTAGLVIIPQAMAYALLATLSPDFGLYTSFAGAATYWLFGTSKDIVIGTTAVGSLLVGEVIAHVHEARPGIYTSVEIAKSLSFMTGLILFAIGLLRLGWLVEVISYIPVSAFITAASLTIMCTQLPVLLGIPDINTRQEPYNVLIQTLRNLGSTQLDAAVGLTCLVLLEVVRAVCARMEVQQPTWKRLWTTLSSLRLTFAMLLYTFVSWLVNRALPEEQSRFRIVGHMEQGFVYAGPPTLSPDLIGLIIPQSPVIVIILLIEHIAIAKNFGKQFGYDVVPSQEILAQGTANTLGPFLGGYSCTGSFGASAVLSKAAVKTPLAGLVSALILLLALYALTSVFYYIPRAALAGLIIHAVLNLVASPATIARYWHLSPFEGLIWVTGVVVAIFTGLETSIYITVGLSFLLLLVRIARTKGRILGQVPVQETSQDATCHRAAEPVTTEQASMHRPDRDIYLSMARDDASNPEVVVASPYPGVLIYHFPEGLNYLNQAMHLKALSNYVYIHTSRTTPAQTANKSDILWCDSPSLSRQDTTQGLPKLQAIVIDCSTIHSIDITSVQGLIDVRNALDRWASPSAVHWHFGGLRDRWARRALAAAGFGRISADDCHSSGHWTPVLSLTSSFGGATEAVMSSEVTRRSKQRHANDESDPGAPGRDISGTGDGGAKVPAGDLARESDADVELQGRQGLRAVFALDRPLFHADLAAAVAAAVADVASNGPCIPTNTI